MRFQGLMVALGRWSLTWQWRAFWDWSNWAKWLSREGSSEDIPTQDGWWGLSRCTGSPKDSSFNGQRSTSCSAEGADLRLEYVIALTPESRLVQVCIMCVYLRLIFPCVGPFSSLFVQTESSVSCLVDSERVTLWGNSTGWRRCFAFLPEGGKTPPKSGVKRWVCLSLWVLFELFFFQE